MTTYELEDVRRTATEIVAERPDYVYPQEVTGSCKYVHDGQPSCLVGQIFFRLGTPIETLVSFDEAENVVEDLMGTAVDDLASGGLIDLDTDTKEYLKIMQRAQDGGHKWLSSLGAAEQYLAERELAAKKRLPVI